MRLDGLAKPTVSRVEEGWSFVRKGLWSVHLAGDRTPGEAPLPAIRCAAGTDRGEQVVR